MSQFLDRVWRASAKTPRQLASRLIEMGVAQLQRPWAGVYPHLLTERALLRAAGATSIDSLWEARLTAPFFVSPERRETSMRGFRGRYPDAQAAIVAAAVLAAFFCTTATAKIEPS